VVVIDSSSGPACQGGAKYSLNWGLQLTLGAELKISFGSAAILAPAVLTKIMEPEHVYTVVAAVVGADGGNASSTPVVVPIRSPVSW
jgi:hypothetical protein